MTCRACGASDHPSGCATDLKTFLGLPALDHDHEWVDTTELQDDERIEICAAGGCAAIRTVPR